MVKIKYMGYIADLIGKREEVVSIKSPIKIEEIIKYKDLDLEEVIILVNGRAGNPETIVSNSDEITVLPVISGG